MLLEASESQLVLVDYQDKLMPVIHEGAQALANAVKLAKMAQLLEVPVWGTEQNPSRLGANNAELKALCQKTLEKMYFSAVPGWAARAASRICDGARVCACGVGTIPRDVRWNNGSPNCSRKRARALLTVDWLKCKRVAARVRFCSCISASNTSSRFRSICRKFVIMNKGHF